VHFSTFADVQKIYKKQAGMEKIGLQTSLEMAEWWAAQVLEFVNG
jgi:hypothetical protein